MPMRHHTHSMTDNATHVAAVIRETQVPQCRYQPLIQADPIIRQPITTWQQSLLRRLHTSLIVGNEDVAEAFNQLALLEAYRGHHDTALSFCQLQITYWRNLANRHRDELYLLPALQPWINTFRLQRWQQQNMTASSLYQQLAPERRNERNNLNDQYAISPTIGELLANPSAGKYSQLIESVYWLESSHQLLNIGDYAGLMQQIQSGLRQDIKYSIRSRLLEIWFKALVNKGQNAYALEALQRMKLTQSHHQLEFRALEMILSFNLGIDITDKAAQIYDELQVYCHRASDAKGLYLLAEFCKIYQQIGSHTQQITLWNQLLSLATLLNDEVLCFDAQFALSQLGQYSVSQIDTEAQYSDYKIIRDRLSLPIHSQHSQPIQTCLTHLAELNIEQSLTMLERMLSPSESKM
ncbi:hypothetical protein [Shewanella sp. CG12_big_fil_rev_8_21_14_0_65_47_15]|uniref:hypothetical protein n=1 Tax=Shewanella sp. CG12_big_fil_rev_8_21_14_0_65_47_15 TaxID=1975537 RepID=UPI0025D3B51F|nr:hypothetical protein [Shewanella sp. CG12_big_fil_rev_8_21_14_0_65_47_15]